LRSKTIRKAAADETVFLGGASDLRTGRGKQTWLHMRIVAMLEDLASIFNSEVTAVYHFLLSIFDIAYIAAELV
jgi:hypothetical protein